jgi:uncharacterized protein YaaW (UPF0174 family)
VCRRVEDYKLKIASLLGDSAYKKLNKDSTDSIERKTTKLLKKSSLPEDLHKQMQPSGSRAPQLYGLPKIHKKGVPLRPIISNIGALTYQLAKHLTGFSLNVCRRVEDYKLKIASLLEDSAYKKLDKDPTDSIERKTTKLLKKSSLPEDLCKQLQPSGSRAPRLYGLPKIHKEGVPLRLIVSNIGAPTYQLAKHQQVFSTS